MENCDLDPSFLEASWWHNGRWLDTCKMRQYWDKLNMFFSLFLMISLFVCCVLKKGGWGCHICPSYFMLFFASIGLNVVSSCLGYLQLGDAVRAFWTRWRACEPSKCLTLQVWLFQPKGWENQMISQATNGMSKAQQESPWQFLYITRLSNERAPTLRVQMCAW